MKMEGCCNCSNGTILRDWEELCSCTGDGAIPVTKYVSKRTGLTVVHADVNGPIVSGFICVPTRATDDDGLPHTLEHLVFLGSEKYPYAGVLDILANKCLASGTNAWTDVDHVCYTLNTTGAAGFEQLLLIYMDHVLYPLLTDEAFKTEIFHVGAHGHDGGIVFSEIVSLENTSFSKAMAALYKELYPVTSGYRWNVGGTTDTLRNSCSNEKVKAFHQRFFHPQNICVIVCGKVNISRIFIGLHHVTTKRDWNRKENLAIQPWLTEEPRPIPDILSAVEKSVEFPCDHRGEGCFVCVGWLGPPIISRDLHDVFAMNLLLKYLCKSPMSPLQRDFVQLQSTLLVSKVDFSFSEYSRPTFAFEFDSVSFQDKAKIKAQLRETLQMEVTNFNLDRMADVIKSEIETVQSYMENSPHTAIAEAVMKDFIYGGNSEERFETRLNKIPVYKILLNEPREFWVNKLLQNCILDVPWVTVYADPSKGMLKRLMDEDSARVESRTSTLGAKGKKNLMVELDQAILKNNSQSIPEKVWKEVKLPSLKSIHYHEIKRYKNPSWVSPADFPCTLCIDDIRTSFVYVGVFMDTSSLNESFRSFLPLFKEAIMNSPILANDPKSPGGKVLLPFEQVCALRERHLQVCQLDFGIEADNLDDGCGSLNHILAFGMQMDLEKVEEGMLWIRRTLWDTQWEMDKINISLNKLCAEAQALLRQGDTMVKALLNHLLYKEDSNVVHTSIISQIMLMEELEMDDYSKFEKQESLILHVLDAILRELRSPDNIAVHLAANMTNLRKKLESSPCNSLGVLLRKCFPFEKQKKHGGREFADTPDKMWMKPTETLVNDEGIKGHFKNQVIYAMRSEDMSYLLMVAPGPSSFLDKDLPALLTAVQYFTQQEGPLFKQVRGAGYAQSYNLVPKVHEGLIYFYLDRCKNLPGAYSQCLSIINNYLMNEHGSCWSEQLLVAAKNSLIFECLETERTPLSLAATSCLDYYRRVPGTFMRTLIQNIAKVKMRHVKKMTKKYLDVLFNSARHNYATVITCPEGIAASIQNDFDVMGKSMRIISSFRQL